MKSPFDKNLDMSISKHIESKKIIDGYHLINVNVERYFLNLTCLELLICPSTGYKQYYPVVLSSILNLPPHHVSLWDKDSILSAFSQYGYSVVKISYEPVYPAWIQRYFQILKYSLFLKASPLHNLLSPLTIKLLSHFSKLLMNKVGIKLAFIKGHSIAVILKKDE
jgi:hypothetical protein